MADRPKGDVARKLSSRPNSNDIQATASSRFSEAIAPYEDVIRSLAAMPENRRARQVFEWETIRRQTMRSSA